MEAHSEIPNNTGFDCLMALESQFIPELACICGSLRKDLGYTDLSLTLEHLDLALAAFCEKWHRSMPQLGDVLQAIEKQRPAFRAIRETLVHLSDPRSIVYQHYLALETIPSQVMAAIEQAKISSEQAPSRHQLLNDIARITGAKKYLEIGCCNNDCFDRVHCPHKVGVDPNLGGTLRMTSDAFFGVNVESFDLVMIDGLHESWQVDKDIRHALQWTSDNALIVLHDCSPLFEVRSLVPRVSETWNGDVWKSLVRARQLPEIDCATGLFDHGCAVICKRPNTALLASMIESDLTWENLQHHRTEWLRTMPYDDLIKWISIGRASS